MKVLFLCTHNSARSQMAEGLLRYLGGSKFEVFSAGTEQTFVRPEAVQVMKEIGIDISAQTSKTLDTYLDQQFDTVITVCEQATESCPVFPNVKQRIHWSFPDPSKAKGNPEKILSVYREVRDLMRERIERELLSVD
ncbi:MAG: arsenate reductase ArsC [Patescibacteria group bacterium]